MIEPSDLARLAAGIPTAILVPLCLPRLRSNPFLGTLLALVLAGIVVSPLMPDAAAWVALAIAPALVLAGTWHRLRGGTDAPNTPTIRDGAVLALSTVLATALCLALLDSNATWHAIETAVESNAAILVASGALLAIFVGGPLVAWVLSPFADALKSDFSLGTSSLRQAGTLIGWFERALFFAFLVAGQPQAAAVALAAKSFARFPSLSKHEEGFAEYFLIGTLASLAIAVALAAAVRAALGLSAL